MGLYDANFANITLNNLPPQKRQPNTIAYLGVPASTFQYLHDSIFGQYMNGFAGAKWAAGAYTIGQQVWYIDNAVYEVMVASTSAIPGSSTDWIKVLNNRIGAIERMNYNGGKLVLEYGLNKWFNTTFRQPPAVPDIYITNSQASDNWFAIGRSPSNSSTIARTDINSDFGIGRVFTYPQSVDFTIYIPLAVSNALTTEAPDVAPAVSALRQNIIRSFADKYVNLGIIYSIVSY